VDDGTSWEIGYFFARKSPEQKIIGIRTDFRYSGTFGFAGFGGTFIQRLFVVIVVPSAIFLPAPS
jgi:hypothetical protein